MCADMKMGEHDMEFAVETPTNLPDLSFTSTWMDSCAMPMMPVASQHQGLYTPNSGARVIFHSQAGDLHTPTLSLNMLAPLSQANPFTSTQANNQHGLVLHRHYLAKSVAQMDSDVQQASYAPSAFMHRDSAPDAMDESVDYLSTNSSPVDQPSRTITSTDRSHMSMAYADGGNFRYTVTLRAPTAMVKHANEIPVSYLNKGQTYNITVMDSNPPTISSEPIQYRTFIRVSFEEDEQKSKPAACWKLWKEGRGLNEAHQRGGKLLAVEYVDPVQGGGDDPKPRQNKVEQTSIDGFCIIWTANPSSGASGCLIPVRFNFLSTDFSHSKGVRGVPVRLCAKTELVPPGEESNFSREPELCYCKVKLFRDHGAERKLSNDVVHVRRTIEKLEQQIAQTEMGSGFGKRKRGSNATSALGGFNQSKSFKHKCSSFINSQGGQTEKMLVANDLQARLAMMRKMFSSTRNVTVFTLRGVEEDDPDLYPVRLASDVDFAKDIISRQNTDDPHRSIESLIISRTSSRVSLSPPMRLKHLASLDKLKHPVPVSRVASGDAESLDVIDVVDINQTYRPPTQQPAKPIACFYIRFAGTESHPEEYYRAIYLTERTAQDLTRKISEKLSIDPERIGRILHVNKKSLQIIVDDDVVRELPEGQDMAADVIETPSPDESGCSCNPVQIKLTY